MDARVRPSGRRSTGGRAAGGRLWIGPVITLIAVALAGAAPRVASAAANVTFDTGSGVAFTISGSNGGMTSLKHNGVELAASGQAAGRFESAWSSATVSSKTFNSGNSILVTAANSGIGVTQYYFARKGDNTIYMATNITATLNPAEARFISRLGASGSAHGIFILPGTNEMSSGGPFFRDIEVNNTGDTTNITAYLFSGHAQTEPMRLGLHGPYAMAVTSGGQPSATSLDFRSSFIPGLLSVAQRGTVSGTVDRLMNLRRALWMLVADRDRGKSGQVATYVRAIEGAPASL